MSKLKKVMVLESALDAYTLSEVIGEGGAGRVYGGRSSDGTEVAVKVLVSADASAAKRRRFKNETAFLLRNRHPHIVTVTDHGLATIDNVHGPFYVMARFQCSLRSRLESGVAAADVLPLYAMMLDGVEAAHLQGVTHRDLKPENFLCNSNPVSVAVCDFGIAAFTDDLLITAVETRAADRLANFVYAAPEQRKRGGLCDERADIYALGLMLNEMFTGDIPQGTEYVTIGALNEEYGFLDSIVAAMIRQSPDDRPSSIREVKDLVARYQAEHFATQRISDIDGTVVPTGAVDDPLAFEPPVVVGFDWDGSRLVLELDREVNSGWVEALRSIGNYSSLMGKGPDQWRFTSNTAFIDARESQIQQLIDHFKAWLPTATRDYHSRLQRDVEEVERRRLAELRAARELEEKRLRVLKSVRL